MIKLFRKPKDKPQRLRDYLDMEFPEELSKPDPEHLTNLKDHLDTSFEYAPMDTFQSIFHMAIKRVV